MLVKIAFEVLREPFNGESHFLCERSQIVIEFDPAKLLDYRRSRIDFSKFSAEVDPSNCLDSDKYLLNMILNRQVQSNLESERFLAPGRHISNFVRDAVIDFLEAKEGKI